jgi:hypothetical protein
MRNLSPLLSQENAIANLKRVFRECPGGNLGHLIDEAIAALDEGDRSSVEEALRRWAYRFNAGDIAGELSVFDAIVSHSNSTIVVEFSEQVQACAIPMLRGMLKQCWPSASISVIENKRLLFALDTDWNEAAKTGARLIARHLESNQYSVLLKGQA